MYKNKLPTGIAVITIALMAISLMSVSSTTVNASPGVTVSPSSTGGGQYVFLTFTVANNTGREIARILIRDDSGDNVWDNAIGGSTISDVAGTDAWSIKENWDNVAENLGAAATALAKVTDNLRKARTAMTNAGRVLGYAAENLKSAGTNLNQSDNTAVANCGTELYAAGINLALAATAMQAEPENLLLVARILENFAGTGGYGSVAGSGTSTEVHYDNSMENLRGAGDNLLADGDQNTDADMRAAGLGLDNAAACIDNHATPLAFLAGQPQLHLDNENSMVDNLKWGKFWWAGEYLENAGAEITNAGKSLKKFGDTKGKIVIQTAGDLLTNSVGPNMTTAGTWLKRAADNIKEAGYALLVVENCIINTENICMDNAKTAFRYMSNVSDNIGRAGRGLMSDNSLLKGGEGPIENYMYTRSDNCENILSGGENLVNAALEIDRWHNATRNIGTTELGGRYLGSASTSADNCFWSAGDNLRDRQRLNITNAASALDNAASQLTLAKTKLKATAARFEPTFEPTNWALRYPYKGEVRLTAENTADQLANGSSKSFTFLWGAPTTGKAYTLKLWYFDNTDYYRGQDTVTVTVEALAPVVSSFKVTQTGGVDNVVGQVRDNGKAKITLVANKATTILSNARIENTDGDNKLPPITPASWTTTDNLTFTYEFSVGVWDNDNMQVRIAAPWGTDAYNNDNNNAATVRFVVDTHKPFFVENGLNFALNKLPSRTQPGTGKSYRLDNNTEEIVMGRVQDDWPHYWDNRFGRDNQNTIVIPSITITYGTTSTAVDLLDNEDFYKAVSLTEGLNSRVTITATDWAGNSENAYIENIFVDTTPPTITFNTITKNIAGVETPVTFTNGIVINDNTPKINMTIVDSGYPTTGWGISCRGTANMYQVTPAALIYDNLYVWLDNDDNCNDSLPLTATAPGYGRLENLVQWTNDNGVYENRIDNAGHGLVAGTYYVIVTANDNLRHVAAGITDNNVSNENWTIAKYYFTIDLTAPALPPTTAAGGAATTVTLGASPAAATKTKSSSVTIAVTTAGVCEAGATVKVYTTTDSGITWTHPTDAWATTTTSTTAGAEGTWSVVVRLTAGQTTGIAVTLTDASGNESARVVYGYAAYDASAPVVTISSPATGTATDKASYTVTGTVTKDSWEAWTDLTGTVQVGSAAAGTLTIDANGNFTTSAALSEGVNTVTIRVTDAAGNLGTASVSIEKTVAPLTTYAIIVVVVALILAAIAIFRKW